MYIIFFLQTPDEIISLSHWHALLKVEDEKAFNLKVNFKLRKEHINPQYFNKMNVALAFQVRTIYSSFVILI